MHSGHIKTLTNTTSCRQNMFKPLRVKETENKNIHCKKITQNKFEEKQVIFGTLIADPAS